MKIVQLIFVICCCLMLMESVVLQAQNTIPLYSGKIPNSLEAQDEEKTDTEHDAVTNVSKPTLSIFLPPKEKANGLGVIICPGGGYGSLVIKREGYDVAKAFNEIGVAAFVLKYRLPNDKYMKNKSVVPLQDVQQAILLVRRNAAAYNINPENIGIMGFSAGGHLASTAGTHFGKVLIENKEGISLRPDFMILIYPVISFSDSLVHTGTMNNLLGLRASAEEKKIYSNELRVTKQTPPTFLVHATDDMWVPVGNSIRFYEALTKQSVPAELHVYGKGNHGFLTYPPLEEWKIRCRNWMISQHWVN